MVEAGLLVLEAEEDVMIDEVLAAIAAVERSDQVGLVARIDVVRADKSQGLAEPSHRLGKARRHQPPVPDPLDVAGAPGQAHQLAGPRQRRFAGVEPLALDRY